MKRDITSSISGNSLSVETMFFKTARKPYGENDVFSSPYIRYLHLGGIIKLIRKKAHPFTFTAGGIGAIIGTLLVQWLRGEFILAGFLGALTAFFILIIVDLIRFLNRRKHHSDKKDDKKYLSSL